MVCIGYLTINEARLLGGLQLQFSRLLLGPYLKLGFIPIRVRHSQEVLGDAL
jgi:hypothetical protein